MIDHHLPSFHVQSLATLPKKDPYRWDCEHMRAIQRWIHSVHSKSSRIDNNVMILTMTATKNMASVSSMPPPYSDGTKNAVKVKLVGLHVIIRIFLNHHSGVTKNIPMGN